MAINSILLPRGSEPVARVRTVPPLVRTGCPAAELPTTVAVMVAAAVDDIAVGARGVTGRLTISLAAGVVGGVTDRSRTGKVSPAGRFNPAGAVVGVEAGAAAEGGGADGTGAEVGGWIVVGVGDGVIPFIAEGAAVVVAAVAGVDGVAVGKAGLLDAVGVGDAGAGGAGVGGVAVALVVAGLVGGSAAPTIGVACAVGIGSEAGVDTGTGVGAACWGAKGCAAAGNCGAAAAGMAGAGAAVLAGSAPAANGVPVDGAGAVTVGAVGVTVAVPVPAGTGAGDAAAGMSLRTMVAMTTWPGCGGGKVLTVGGGSETALPEKLGVAGGRPRATT